MDGVDTVLFDLDGTLLDTAGDLGHALNVVLVRYERAPLPLESIRPFVSRGGMALVCLGFNLDAESEQAQRLYRELLDFYRLNLSVNTCFFPGVESLLGCIDGSARRCGVVTNKPGFLTAPLLDDMGLSGRMACVVSGDTLERRKPWPEPLWHACEVIGTTVGRSVYVGDDARDIEAGQRAGMRTIAAAYGYIAPGEGPHKWGADLVVEHPDEIWRWLEGNSGG